MIRIRLIESALGGFLALGIGLGSAQAAVVQVPLDFPAIQAAIDASDPGDTILVAPGDYPGSIDFGGKDIDLRSSGRADNTTIAGSGGPAVIIGPGAALVGFTITGGGGFSGAGTQVLGSGTLIQGNIYEGNAQDAGGFGAAIGGNGASPTIVQNMFRNNTCDDQYLSGVVSFINTSSPLIANNLFLDNPCRAVNMTLPEGSAPVVVNNTLVGNEAGIRVDARVNAVLEVYRNNLLVDNVTGLEVFALSPGDEPTWENNLVFGNGTDYDGIADLTGSAGNISADPLFVSPGNDLHLQPGSPAIDAGSEANAPLLDFDGNSRPVDGDGSATAETDIGAYEFIATAGTVGGTATGQRIYLVVCRNRSTGQSVVVPAGGARDWDCEAQGLDVTPGQVIEMYEIGVAD